MNTQAYAAAVYKHSSAQRLTAKIFPLRLLSSPNRCASSTVVTPSGPAALSNREATEDSEAPSTSSLHQHATAATTPNRTGSQALPSNGKHTDRASRDLHN